MPKPLRILPHIHLSKPPAVALTLHGRLFSECPNCGAVRSQEAPREYPQVIACPCGQTYTIHQEAHSAP